jgi:antitoxin ChpS
MSSATLRTVGGSIVLSIPKNLLNLVDLDAGSRVTITVQNNQILITPQTKIRYQLKDLVAQCKTQKNNHGK